jgi:hypothetical protein
MGKIQGNHVRITRVTARKNYSELFPEVNGGMIEKQTKILLLSTSVTLTFVRFTSGGFNR